MTLPNDDELPVLDLDIEIQTVTAAPRAMQSSWTLDAATDLRDLWGGGRKKRVTPLKRLVDVLDDPTYDPDNPPENEFEFDTGDSTESDLVAAMAKEMSDEIDREILATLQAAGGCDTPVDIRVRDPERPPPFDVVIKVETRRAIELAERDIVYDLHDQIMKRMRPAAREPSQPDGADPQILYHPSYGTMP